MGTTQVPEIVRPEIAEPFRDQILEQFAECKGNLVRVHEELVGQGLDLSYPGLTAFCRRHGLFKEPAPPVGEYTFPPGKEMQQDTSPHQANIAARLEKVETSTLVLPYSHLLFFQHYPTFNRFYCKLFFTDAVTYLEGSCDEAMVDNTHVIVHHGSGARMVPVPEMAAFAAHLGFEFRAHEIGDSNRKAQVERAHYFIETNFLAGRRFKDFGDLNRQAVDFCNKANAKHRRHLHASPRELFARERPFLNPLPIHIPEVYQLHHRIVDVRSYVSVHGHHYSAPYTLIGLTVEVRETRDRVDIYRGPRCVASHKRLVSTIPATVSLPEHRPPREARPLPKVPREEQQARDAAPDIAIYIDALQKRVSGVRGTLSVRRLASFIHDYPQQAVLTAVRTATIFGLFDMDRLERLILRAIATEYFVIPTESDDDDEEE